MTALDWDSTIINPSGKVAPEPEPETTTAQGEPEPKGDNKPLGKGLPEAPEDGKEATSLIIESWHDVQLNPPKKAPALIGGDRDGILRLGDVMLFVAASKAGKTWAALELASAIATGSKWLGMTCRKGRVLYLNCELQKPSLAASNGRLSRVWNYLKEQGIDPASDNNLDFVHLRGHPILDAGIKTLCERLAESITAKAFKDEVAPYGYYEAIIFDPFYACSNADENSASEIKAELRNFQGLAEATGASVIYVHHHAKGASGGKASIDRGAGSGVHGRLPDLIVDMSELAVSDKKLKAVRERFADENASVSRVSFNPRDFAPKKPLEVVFSYPIHHIAPADLQLETCAVKGKNVGDENKQEKNEATWAERNLIIALAVDQHPEGIGRTELYRALASTPLGTVSEDTFKGWLKDNRCDFESVEAPPIEGKKKRWLIQRKPGR